ncbi:MAG: sensor histidine kinase [Akkermansiaceae bacterium]
MIYRAFIAFVVLFSNISQAQDLALERKSHPHFPDEQDHGLSVYKEEELMPARSLKDLVKQENWLRKQLKRFPPSESRLAPPQQNFGHLCVMRETSSGGVAEEWISVQLNPTDDLKIEGVALIPAYYPDHSSDSNYGFPKRFKIEAFSQADRETPLMIADWTQKDFPDPGLFPVLFSTPNIAINKIKLTVTKGAMNGESQFFALDELMVFRAGNAVVFPVADGLIYSSGEDSEPFWHPYYLMDRQTHLGKYLHAQEDHPDFIYDYENAKEVEGEVAVTVDLGEIYSLGRLEIHAAKDPKASIPAIPLPKEYKIELLKGLQPSVVKHTESIVDPSYSLRQWHALYSKDARYLRLTFYQLPLHEGKPTLALGELRVIGDQGENRANLALGKKAIISGKPATSLPSTDLLVDGFTRGRKIVPERLYMEQLAKRAIVERAHADVVDELAVATAIRTQLFWTVGIVLGILILFCLILWFIHLRNEKKGAVLEVQKRIAADLHDDISGNLGTISMISNRLHSLENQSLAKKKLREINYLAQESYLSIKEIIWHTESEGFHLSDLFSQIKRTARSILIDCRVSYEFPDNFNDTVVPAAIRRNVMLLVKESLYNCSKYAKAQNMVIRAQVDESSLILTMRDDGCGFDGSCDTAADSESGRGLKNMERRAKLLGADLSIHSRLGAGTEIYLTIPLGA